MGEITVKLPREEDIPAFSRLYSKCMGTGCLNQVLTIVALSSAVFIAVTLSYVPVLIAVGAAIMLPLGHRIQRNALNKLEAIMARFEEHTLRDADHIMNVADLRDNAFRMASEAARVNKVEALRLYRKVIIEYAAGRGAIAEMQELRALADKRN